MKKLRLPLLMICAALVIPALSQAEDCTTICRDEYIRCIETSCPGGSFCSACDGVYGSCLDWCENQTSCIPPGGTDDTLFQTDCCSGQAVPGSTTCANPADYGTTWASCTHTCA